MAGSFRGSADSRTGQVALIQSADLETSTVTEQGRDGKSQEERQDNTEDISASLLLEAWNQETENSVP